MSKEIERCPICNWPMAASVKEGCVPGNCSQRPAPLCPVCNWPMTPQGCTYGRCSHPPPIATTDADEITRLRCEVFALKVQLADAVVNAAINAHCPGCNCFEDDPEDETVDVFDPWWCSACKAREKSPHLANCHRQGIVTEADCLKEPNA